MRRSLCWVTVLLGVVAPFCALPQAGPPPQPVPPPPSSMTILSTGNLNPPLNSPQGMAVDGAGNLFFADTFNHRIIEITSAGVALVVAGIGNPCPPCQGGGFSGDNGLATNAQLNNPAAVAVDEQGFVYVADSGNNRIRKFRPGGNITTVAGTGNGGGFSGDGGPATSAFLNNPIAVAVDLAGNVFIADMNNSRIRMVSGQTGIITTVAGTVSNGFSGDSGPATNAQLFQPAGVAVDSAGNTYIIDNNRIRRFRVGGNILTVAGSGNNFFGPNGDGGPASAASMNVNGLAVDSSQNLYIVDMNHNSIRMVRASDGVINTIVNGGIGQFFNQRGLAVDSNGDVFVANSAQQVVEFKFSAVRVGSVAAPVGSTAQIPVTVNLSGGVPPLDSIGISVQVAPAAGGPLTFTPAQGIPAPFSPPATATSLALAWSQKLNITGTVQLGTIGVPIPSDPSLAGQSYSVTIAQAVGDRTDPATGALTRVTLALGAAAQVTVTAQCSYYPGDVYPATSPATNNHCGQFGDDSVTIPAPQFLPVPVFEDVLTALRIWSLNLPACTDLNDALDLFDSSPGVNALGSDGQQTDLSDVYAILQLWAGIIPAPPLPGPLGVRTAGSYLQTKFCSAAPPPPPAIAPQIASRQTRRRRHLVAGPAGGKVQLAAAEIRGSQMRVPIYVNASQPLTSIGISVGWPSATVPLRFTAGRLGTPSLLDTKVDGLVTAAWLHDLPQVSGQRVLIGYLEWDRTQGAPENLEVFKAEGIGQDLTPLNLEFEDASLQ